MHAPRFREAWSRSARAVLVCEAAACREGFRVLELVATVAGEPLYLACGFSIIHERFEVPTSKAVTVPCARMAKPIIAPTGLTP